MRPERILLPLDFRKCPVEVFSAANAFARHSGATVTLLHVVTLNISMPENRVYEELGRDARWHLERLARVCLRPGLATVIRVRVGKPAEEIMAEAAAANVDLIILPSHRPSFWNRLFAPILPRVVEQVIREAPCGVFLTSAKNRFNCEKIWGRPGNEIDAALLDHLDGALESKTSPVLLTEHAWASTREQHCAAA
jgi:nucleotide-binding universal stress UspA family protein